jgi:hypothetical protein
VSTLDRSQEVAVDQTVVEDERRAERGVSMVLGAMVLLVLLGMAGFAVDLGWLFYQQTNTRKAAEAAALAGVVHMPQPSDVAFADGEAYATALDVAERNGYIPNPGVVEVVPTQVPGEPYQLEVEVTDTVDTFFMRVFGIDQLEVHDSATAEQLPALKLGSDENHLGPGNSSATDEDFWVAINGDHTWKSQGDAFTAECLGHPDESCQGTNPEYGQGDNSVSPDAPSYWYAVEVPADYVGDSLQVQIFDPQTSRPGGPTDDRSLSNPNWSTTNRNSITRFRLLEPDGTPGDPTDNSVQVCSQNYRQYQSGSYNFSWEDVWVSFCTTTAKRGTYVLEVRQSGNVNLLNAFSIRARINGSTSNTTAVYGLGSMSLWFPNPNSTAEFKVVKLDAVYAGQQLIISLWDPGDLDDPGALEFTTALSGIDSEVRERDDEGNTTADWHADDGNLDSGAVGCHLDIAIQEHNNEWVDFSFDIPATYTCADPNCWAIVDYDFPGVPHDRTTWAATVNGQPIHLVD